MTIAKVQHYVPQFLLRNFGRGKKDQLWVFDKTTGRSFFTNAKNVASESRFYDFEVDAETISLEPILTKVESDAKRVIEKILDADSLGTLSQEERGQLSVFCSIQMARTRNFREQWLSFPRMLREEFARRGDQVAKGSQAEQLIQDLSENEVKADTGRFMLGAPEMFAEHFLSKHWVLAATDTKHPFQISDNPLTRQNMIERPFRGNLGLTVPGIEIYLPLTPTRALAMWCTSLTVPILEREEELRKAAPGYAEALAEALRTGNPLAYAEENVTNFNSLQVWQAERYVFSSTEDFALARDMVASSVKLRTGPRMRSMGDEV
jgi:hypothetical protein